MGMLPFVQSGARTEKMEEALVLSAATATEQKAIRLLEALERAGKTVSSVVVEGRRIEVKFEGVSVVDEFEGIEMRYGKA